MGCFNSTSKKEIKSIETTKLSISSHEGRKQQGVTELKQNYVINNKTKVLGVGAFGRVFMTTNAHD